MSVPNRPESEYNAALKMWGKVGGSHPPAPAYLRPLMVVPARAGHAKELLENPGVKIKDVANLVGFEDEKYFSRQFHKSTGLSPNDFRAQLNLKNETN